MAFTNLNFSFHLPSLPFYSNERHEDRLEQKTKGLSSNPLSEIFFIPEESDDSSNVSRYWYLKKWLRWKATTGTYLLIQAEVQKSMIGKYKGTPGSGRMVGSCRPISLKTEKKEASCSPSRALHSCSCNIWIKILRKAQRIPRSRTRWLSVK